MEWEVWYNNKDVNEGKMGQKWKSLNLIPIYYIYLPDQFNLIHQTSKKERKKEMGKVKMS